MAVDEVRIRLRRKLEEMLGVNEADLLMDRPPGGWDDLVTKDYLDLRLEALEHKMSATFHREMTLQTWRFVGAMTALVAVFAAVVKL